VLRRSERNALHPQKVTAQTEDGVCMALQHESYPMVRGPLRRRAASAWFDRLRRWLLQAAVQFHPESIMTEFAGGMRMLNNVMTKLR